MYACRNDRSVTKIQVNWIRNIGRRVDRLQLRHLHVFKNQNMNLRGEVDVGSVCQLLKREYTPLMNPPIKHFVLIVLRSAREESSDVFYL